jgi:hypothetical protein
VILEVAHLFEHFFAIVDTANKELTSSHCWVICGLYVKVLWKWVYRFYGVVCKQRYDSFKSKRFLLKHFGTLCCLEFYLILIQLLVSLDQFCGGLERICGAEEHLGYRAESSFCSVLRLFAQHIWR